MTQIGDSKLKITLVLLLTALVPLPCFAGGVPVTFQIDPLRSLLLVELTASSGPISVSDSDSSPMSGTIEALIDFDGSVDPPPQAGINFTGGRQYVDETLNMSLFVFLLLNVDVQIVDLSNTLGTRVPQGLLTMVAPTTYEFDAAQHIITQDQGTFSVVGTAIGNPVNELIDFAAMPVIGTADPNTIGSLVVQESGAIGTGKYYQAEITFPIDFIELVPIEGFPGQVTIDVSGSMVGTATFAVPLGLPGDFDDDVDVDGTDFLTWQRSFGNTVSPGTVADDNLNGVVDVLDLKIWQENYGEPGNTLRAIENQSLAIPEPVSLLTYCLGLIFISAFRRH